MSAPDASLNLLAQPSFRQAVRRNLLRWFTRHARDLPWRQSRAAYPIWISEVMLQQTQVATVIPYFERFLQRFPDLATLARAEEHEVLQHWEGLGYYRRARDLHRAARLMVADHAGHVPAVVELLRQLPGFGRYTANAVLSQAHDQRLPILEANSQRVLCRLLGLRVDPKQPAAQKTLWAAAEALLPTRQVGNFNQALMEVGALVCTPAKPACSRCPLRGSCVAFGTNQQETIPLRASRERGVQVDEVAVVVRHGEEVLLVQRPAAGRWGSLWEFPHTELALLETHAAAAQRLLAEHGLRATITRELTTIRHTVTRFHITMVCLEARTETRPTLAPSEERTRWLAPAALANYPMGVPQRQLAQLLVK